MTRALLKDVSPLLVPEENPTESLSHASLRFCVWLPKGTQSSGSRDAASQRTNSGESTGLNLMDKLGLSSPAQLVRYAIEHGLLE